MASDVNVVALTGRLTKDPELKHIPSGTAVCEMRMAFNTRKKDASGEWSDKGNFINVIVWGAHGENCARYLSRGSRLAVNGRLDWREWEAKEGGGKRSVIDVVAEQVVFLDGRKEEGAQSEFVPVASTESGGYGVPGSTAADDDIPF